MLHPRSRHGLAALACAMALSSPALADNYVAKDGNAAPINFAAKLISGVLYPFHLMMGQVGGTGAPQPLNVDTNGNLGVNPNAFTPTGATVSLSAGNTSSSVAINAGPTEVVSNNGATVAYVAFGASGMAATTSSYPILPGTQVAFNTTAGFVAAISASGTDLLTVAPGTGQPIISGAGGGATTALQSAGNASLATIASNTAGSATSALQSTANTALGAIQTNTTGLSTSALQTTGNGSLSTIASNTAGAATAANQATANTALGAIQTNTAGGATSALQTTGNTALAAIQAAAQSQATVPMACATAASSTGAAANCNVSTPNTALTGSLAAATVNNTVAMALPKAGEATLALSVAGIVTTAPVITSYKSYDGGTTYQLMNSAVAAGNSSSAISANGNYTFNVAGATNVEFVVTTAGTAATVSLNGQVSTGVHTVSVMNQPVVGTLNYAISTSSSGVAQAVAGVTGKTIYITHWDVVLAGAGGFQLEYSTGSACASPVALTGAYALSANGGISVGGGLGQVIALPAGAALCINNTSAVAAAGEITYAQQ